MNKTLLILAGGFGTRLKSAVADVPKVLAPIGNLPFLHMQLENWLSLGLKSFIFSLHHESEQIIAFLKKEEKGLLKGCNVKWVVEPEPLNTGGAIAYVLKNVGLKGDFFLTNGDTWLGDGFSAFCDKKSPSMGIFYLKNSSRYGRVLVDDHNFVTSFTEKSPGNNPGWINAGVSLLNSHLFENWDGLPFSLETDLFPELVKKRVLKSVALETQFIDIGIPEDYKRFCDWSAKKGECES